MFTCDRCGSKFSAMHAATLENCPRCQVRDRIAVPLTFKAFRLPEEESEEPTLAEEPGEVAGRQFRVPLAG